MPRTSAYTTAPRRLAQLAAPARADLHTHTTASDGEYTPSQVVALARQAGLAAVAVTDHDTLAGVAEAQAAAAGTAVEVVAGVEISTSFAGREFHLLGYFVRLDHSELNAALARVCASRRERFRELVALLPEHARPAEDRVRLVEEATSSPGRRHVAGLVVAAGAAKTRDEAFRRFLHPIGRHARPKALVPIEDAIALVHAAGGVASLAHPPRDLTDEQFAALRAVGLDAVEAAYPWGRSSPGARLRRAAAAHGLAVTGGSDCHGPDPAHRRVGTCAITSAELAALRERTGRAIG